MTMRYSAVVGAEAHVQLNTSSKLFCSCSAEFGGEPNSRCCPVCLGFPGVLPVLNRKAVELTMLTALALHCHISEQCRFARKNYFYPDLPKNYQISQYEEPIGSEGFLDLETNGEAKRIRVRRVHLEEDTGKSIHTPQGTSLVDFNRCGVPLMEIVAEPDIASPQEARAYYAQLHSLLLYLGVTTGSMEEGVLRCEPNVSVMAEGAQELGTKVELKNLNSFRAVLLGLEYEVNRQIECLKKGEGIVQETRRWDEQEGVTVSMRSKEWAHDYRYFPEPDLLPMRLDRAWIEEIERRLPEMPEARRRRFMAEYDLPEYDARLLTESQRLAGLFERCVARFGEPKMVSNWLMGSSQSINATLPEKDEWWASCAVELLDLQKKGAISATMAKKISEEMFATGKRPSAIVQEDGLTQVSEQETLEEVIGQVLRDNTEVVRRILGGKPQAKAFLVGQVMKATNGRANPGLVVDLLEKALERASSGVAP